MRLAVCSWSLRPESVEELVAGIGQVAQHSSAGSHGNELGVQLALDPIRRGGWDLSTTRDALQRAGIPIVSGMMEMEAEDYSSLESIRHTGGVRLDEHWARNLEAARANAEIAEALGLSLVTFHAGFLPHEASDPLREVMLDRLRQVADAFAQCGVRVGLETGQESAHTLLDVLRDLELGAQLGVNFDPANMILYGMGDPVQAFSDLLPHVLQVHLKDAVATQVPGTWGEEVVVGTGEVDFAALIRVLREHDVDCVLEREAGETRVADLAAGAKHFMELWQPGG